MCYEYNKLEWLARHASQSTTGGEREMDMERWAEPGDVVAEPARHAPLGGAGGPEVQPSNVPGHKPESERNKEPVTIFEKERLLSSLR